MSRRRSGFRPIPGTPAACAYRRVERDGVAVLCVRLAGWTENSADGVGRVTDALDELAAAHAEHLDVTTLDVRGFANASDDACGILTGVFPGLPCCWISGAWDQQRGGQRWDLPPSDRLAPTGEAALARVIAWRRAGGFTVRVDDTTRTYRWTERGLQIATTRGGAPDCDDLWHRNRLVERVLHRDPATRVLWPVADDTGVAHEAQRRGARLEVVDGRVLTADFSEWQTGRPLPDDWAARISDLESLEHLVLRGAAAREADILRALRAHPNLRSLTVEPTALGPDAQAQLRRERPDLTLTLR